MIRYALMLVAVTVTFGQSQPSLEGDWRGALSAGGSILHLALHVDKASDGLYIGRLNSIDQGAVLPLDTLQLKGDHVTFTITQVGGSFEGTLSGDKLKGTWTQGMPLPLELTRETAAAPAKATGPAKLTTADMKMFGVPLDLYVPTPPTPVLMAGKIHMIYELHVTNGGDGTAAIKRLEVLGAGKKLAEYEGLELNGMMHRDDDSTDDRSLPPGVRAEIFLDIAVDPASSVPQELRHRITVEDLAVEGGTATVISSKPVVIGPPLRGAGWFAANGPSNTSIHRRALIAVDGGFHIGQRFAIDWLKMDSDGNTHKGDPKDNRNYHAYGSEVLAVADATVVKVKDGIPENVPGPTSRAVPMTLETIAGNHVVLDLGGGRYAVFAHLQPGKIRVKEGDKVKRGQILGLLGNSGNSTEPHLHFQICSGMSTLGSEGLPYVLDSLGALPAQNAMVKFN